jgi:predicted PurR-regulated permease PerM
MAGTATAEEALAGTEAEAPKVTPKAAPATVRGPVSWGILTLSVLAVIYTLYLGKEIILPVVVALILGVVLAPVMRFLSHRLRIPRAIAAAFVIVAVFGAVVGVGFTVSRPAMAWIKKIPESIPVLKEKLAAVRAPIDFLENGLRELQGSSDDAEPAEGQPAAEGAAASGGKPHGMTLGSLSGFAGTLASGTAGIASRFMETLIVLFFLLVSGDRLLRGFLDALPDKSDKRRVVSITRKIETNVAGYLAVITAMNLAVGVATGLAMWACGLGTPILWGSIAFALNYVPILGPLAAVAIFFTAGLLTLAWPLPALLPAILYFAIHLVEGETVTPMLLAKRFTLNPVLVIVSLFFWNGIWGITGALLAVPLLAIIKVVCDHVERLKPVGRVIGA